VRFIPYGSFVGVPGRQEERGVSALLPPAPTQAGRRPEPSAESAWDVLERFGEALQACEPARRQTRLVLEAVQEGLGAEAVYWHPGPCGDGFDRVGPFPLSADWCGEFTEYVLARNPSGAAQLTRAFLDPAAKPATPWPCSAALVRISRSRGTWLGALSFHPRRIFGAADLKVMMLARRMVLNRRQQAQAHEHWKDAMFSLAGCLSAAVDARDPCTRGHSERVARAAVRLGREAGLAAPALRDLYLAGLLHDLGKVGLRDEVLQKPASLTGPERAHVQEHPLIADRLLADLAPLQHLRPAVRGHHERWDGAGYPDGLAGEAIPLAARILAVADAFAAMISPRAFRAPLPPARAAAVLAEGAGSQWDPVLVQQFLACRDEMCDLCLSGGPF
jgi:hypothetical protein